MSTKIGDIYDIKIGPDGKTIVVKNEKRVEAKKPVSARRAKPKTKFQAVKR